MNCELFTAHGLRCPRPVKYGGALLAVFILAAFAAWAPRFNGATFPSGSNSNAVEVLLADLNAHRQAAGLVPLELHPKLDYVAAEHADDMVVHDYFNHVSPAGVSPFHLMHQANIHYVWAGENIAESDYATAAAKALWKSPEHRANILNPHYRHVGIGTRQRPSGVLVFVEEFSN